MYPVSEEYRKAMKSAVQRYKLMGTVDGVSFTECNILAGSFSITNQCSDNNSLEIGQVYVGELNATFLDMPIAKYGWADKQIEVSFGQMLEDGTYEYVPLGIFNISEANWTVSGVVVKAYDNMSKLDKSCGLEQSSGKAHSLAKIACDACHVTLGTAKEEFESFVNGKETLSMYTENDIDTWRDYLAWLSQALGCFVTAGRDGSIVFRPFNKTVIDEIDTGHRFTGCSFSDYETRYTGISVVNIQEATTSYYGMEEDDGLTMNLGSNPFLQYGVEETVERIRRAVLSAVGEIDYVPFKASMIGNPAYDLGDVFSFTGGIADSDRLFCMTKFSWKFNDTYEMQGVGENPALATAKSKTDKNISGLIKNMDSSSMNYSTFMNSEEIDIADGAKEIIAMLRIAVVEQTHVDINAEILCEVETTVGDGEYNDAEAEVEYMLDGTVLTSRAPVQTLYDGRHIIHLQYVMLAASAMLHTFSIYMKMSGGRMHIDPTAVLIVVSGMGLAGTSEWDGTIDVYDTISTYDIMDPVTLLPMRDRADVAFIDAHRRELTDTLGVIDIMDNFTLIGLSDGFESIFTGYRFLPSSEGAETSQEITVSNGMWTGIGTVITPDTAVDHIVRVHGVSSGNTVVYCFAFNGSDTWVAHNGETWTENYTNTDAQLSEIPKEAYEGVTSIRVKATLSAGSLQSININTEGY